MGNVRKCLQGSGWMVSTVESNILVPRALLRNCQTISSLSGLWEGGNATARKILISFVDIYLFLKFFLTLLIGQKDGRCPRMQRVCMAPKGG